MIDNVSLNGVKVYLFGSLEDVLLCTDSRKGIFVSVNAELILHATDRMRDIVNRNVGYCDGAGIQLALKRKGYKHVPKIAGCELWLKIVERSYRKKTFYLVGARQKIIEETVAGLRKDFEGINILGWRNGYLQSSEERQALVDDIARKKPDVVFVAMESPMQELLMDEIRQRHDAVFLGLGGSFDVYTGHVKRAPRWWVEHNLEFAYRLIKEPKRIKRQVHLVRYAWWLLTKQL